MINGPNVVTALESCGVTHVVWIPDTELGTWEPALLASKKIQLVRVCREGEAFALAAGLWLGGQQPVVLLQCTGLFEAGDALRNIIHDLNVPLFFLVGVRSYYLHQQGQTADTCPVFTEPIMEAWRIHHTLLDRRHTAQDVSAAYRRCQAEHKARAVLLAE